MKITGATIHCLKIPFNFSFGHFLKTRSFLDSIVVELTSENGVRGYGEGVARPYVTGETLKKSIKHIQTVLLPAVMHRTFDDIDTGPRSYKSLSHIYKSLPDTSDRKIVAWNASKAAVEIALIDCLLKNQQQSLGSVIPPKSNSVTYSAILSSGNLKSTVELAERAHKIGFRYVKIKVGRLHDHERIAAVRDIMGQQVSIRLDANGAFTVKNALKFIEAVEKYGIDSLEQPVKRGDVKNFAAVKADSPIPIMADESIVTPEDAACLIENDACDYFNLRVSKCGGIYNTLAIADTAERAGIKIQLGSMAGETAILSTAGRHIAAYLPDTKFVEGSAGTYLLSEDIAKENVMFGQGGEAPILTGNGLGIHVLQEQLKKYTVKLISV